MRKLILATIVFCIQVTVLAQSLSDIQNMKVDSMSDAQIAQLIMRAESSGINEQQLVAAAMERGMPSSEVAKLRQRILNLRRRGGNSTAAANRLNQGIGNDEYNESNLYMSRYDNLTETQDKIFGYKLFHNSDLNFNPNLNIPTPPNYTLGVGDRKSVV